MAIRPTFYGFEMARSALAASQRNIDVTGQNISNINTPGYSRQRVNLSSIGVGGMEWKYAFHPADNVGLGVNMDSIQRVRDEFLDVRFWKENGDNSRFAVKSDVLSSLEGLLDEFTTDNVHAILSDFNNALQELNAESDEVEYASNLRMIAMTLTRTLNKAAVDIGEIEGQTLERLTLVKDQVNYVAKALNDINTEVRNQKLLGPVSNDLLDKRDLLLDQLSGYGNMKITYDETGGVNVFFGIGEDDEILLVDGSQSDMIDETEAYYNILEFDTETDPYRLTWASGDYSGQEVIVTAGEIYGYYEMLNGIGDVEETGDTADLAAKGIPYFMNMLDDFSAQFADTFNELNDAGDLFDSVDGDEIKAYNIRVSDEWKDDPQFIVRTLNTDSDTPNAAQNDNILRMIDALKREDRIMEDGFSGSFQQYIGSLNSEITIEVNYNDKQLNMSDGLILNLQNMRESIMGVSEDEEAMNLMRYQKSYTAAARLMTTLDEMLELIVTRLGLVGR